MKFAHSITSVALLLALAACTQSTSENSDTIGSDIVKAEGVSGNILLEGDTTDVSFPFTGVVEIRDVSLADGPSTTLASQTITVTGPGPIPFEISVEAIQENASYTVYAHLDTDADETVSEGDFITMESFPVLTFGHGTTVDVTAKRYSDIVKAEGVSGNILLEGDTTDVSFPFTGVVEIRDVSLADGPSTTLASQTITVTGPGPIPFEISVEAIQENASYTVYAHLDTDADETVSEGDFITMESFPVLTFGHGTTVDVTAKRY